MPPADFAKARRFPAKKRESDGNKKRASVPDARQSTFNIYEDTVLYRLRGVSSCPHHAGKATPCRKEVDFAVSRRREALRKASPRGKVVRLLYCTVFRARLARTTANAAFHHATPITQEKRHPVGYRFSWWEEVDSNHRSRRRQIYSLIHLAALESSRI